MKLSFATILPLLSLTLSPAIAVPNLPVVNGIQLERVTVGDNVFYGEPASLLEVTKPQPRNPISFPPPPRLFFPGVYLTVH
ncbi:hypothetical protein BDW59DRAFT_161269 [Aspergillus cavernicola]|uniref:Uncharacterized protein n=1 Tax=Aspergillus cavernicola TaxID=176166 RepID=A0ABR4IEF9_9EURO